MSETPTLPISDEQTTPSLETTSTYNLVENDRRFESWRSGVNIPRYDRPQESFDLERDEPLNNDIWASAEEYQVPVQAIEGLEATTRPQTRAQEVEESLFYLDDRALLAYALQNTRAIITMRQLI